MNPHLNPSQEGNLQPALQRKLPSSEGLGVGSWSVRTAWKPRKLLMNRSSRREEALTSFSANRMSLLTSAATMGIGSFVRMSLVFGLSLVLAVGCSKTEAPPKAIAVEQAPTSLEEAFKGAKPEAKQLADEAVAALGSKDYTKALFALQSLAGRSDLTPQQRDMASRSMLAVNKALAEQAGSGDEKAQQTLQLQRSTK
jgi:hypothetical protein